MPCNVGDEPDDDQDEPGDDQDDQDEPDDDQLERGGPGNQWEVNPHEDDEAVLEQTLQNKEDENDDAYATATVLVHDIVAGNKEGGNVYLLPLSETDSAKLDVRKVTAKLNLLHSANQFSRDRLTRIIMNKQCPTTGMEIYGGDPVIAAGVYVSVLYYDDDNECYMPYFGLILRIVRRPRGKQGKQLWDPIKLTEAKGDNTLFLWVEWLEPVTHWKTSNIFRKIKSKDGGNHLEIESSNLINCPTITRLLSGLYEVNADDLRDVLEYVAGAQDDEEQPRPPDPIINERVPAPPPRARSKLYLYFMLMCLAIV